MRKTVGRVITLGMLALVPLLIVGCGGGDDVEVMARVAQDSKKTALAAPAGTDTIATSDRLLNFAEQSFPEYFPGHEPNRYLDGWVYRYYPTSGTYIAVIDWRVYILGGPFGPEVRDVGEVTQYVAAIPMANQPPVITLTSPTAGTVIAPASISMGASATDTGGSVSRVEFYAGATKVGEAASAPYLFIWTNVPPGTYSITAVAIDNLGSKTTSQAASVIVAPNKAPTVLLTSPISGASFTAPATVALAATPSDDAGIAKVEFFAGATKLGEDTIAPYSFNWINAAAGSYTLTALATDTAGLSSTSNAIAITVQPAPPTPSPAGVWSAARLATCPTISGSSAKNYYLCMIGGLTGTQLFDPSKTCTVSISSTGTAKVSSGGETYTVSTDGTAYFTKASYLLVMLDNPVSVYPSIDITIKSVTESGKSFFLDGGKLQVDAESFDPRPTPSVEKSLSCIFDVPKI